MAAFDGANQIDEEFTGTVVFTSSDPAASLPAPYRFTVADRGIHRFPFVARTPGSQTLVASEATGAVTAGRMTRNAVASAARPNLTQQAIRVPGSWVAGLTSGPGGTVWFSASGGNTFFPLPIPSGFGRITPEGDQAFFNPGAPFTGGIVRGSDGNLWYASAGDGFSVPGRIGRMTPSGAVTLFDVPASRSAPQDVALGPDGNVWFADANSAIGRITPTGKVTLFPTPASGSVPFHITNGPDGALWFTDYGARRIGRIDVTGSIQEFEVPARAGGPWAIAAGADGRVWFTTNSSFVGSIGTLGDVQTVENPVGAASYGIGAGPDGAVWFGRLGFLVRIVPGHPARPELQPIPLLFGRSAQSVITGPDGRLWIGQYGQVIRATLETCASGGELCLDGRFRARVDYRAPNSDVAAANPLMQTGNAGHFTFFTPNNVDLTVKVVDGRPFNGHYWVFAASLTNVEFTLTVTDTATGQSRTYRNAAGRQSSIADTAAF
ncbi:MAG: hypothetical protein LC796_09880 [Acidobacteria bacterium]|nr:hypothetical protein [Acidobacteriota bacterium]